MKQIENTQGGWMAYISAVKSFTKHTLTDADYPRIMSSYLNRVSVEDCVKTLVNKLENENEL